MSAPSDAERQAVELLRGLGYSVVKVQRSPVFSCEEGHNHKTPEAKALCEHRRSRRTGLTVSELAEKAKLESGPRYLAAYKMFAEGMRKADVAREFGVSPSRAAAMIRRGWSLAVRDGINTVEP